MPGVPCDMVMRRWWRHLAHCSSSSPSARGHESTQKPLISGCTSLLAYSLSALHQSLKDPLNLGCIHEPPLSSQPQLSRKSNFYPFAHFASERRQDLPVEWPLPLQSEHHQERAPLSRHHYALPHFDLLDSQNGLLQESVSALIPALTCALNPHLRLKPLWV